MKKIAAITLAIAMIFTTTVALSHSGRTDSSGGHKDNKNVSGLGSYHYHCGGNPPHLHSGGVCPYSSSSQIKATAKPTAKPTSKPASGSTQTNTQSSSLVPAQSLSPSEDGKLSEPVKGKMNAKSVNARVEPKAKAKSVKLIEKKGTEIEIIGIAYDDEGEIWYIILIGDIEAYIPAKYVDLIEP